jgi:hypothetical protein
MKGWLIGGLLVAFAVSGCGGNTTVKPPSAAVQRAVAGQFAEAVLRGDAAGARALLVRTDDGTLAELVEWAAAPWRAQHAAVRLPARRTGNRWTFGYAGRRTQSDGRFETRSGNLVVVVGPSGTGAGVESFIVTRVQSRFSTHHDSQLLPSKR